MAVLAEILSLEIRTFLSYINHTKAADDLAMQEARTLAALVLIWISWNSPAAQPEGLICCTKSHYAGSYAILMATISKFAVDNLYFDSQAENAYVMKNLRLSPLLQLFKRFKATFVSGFNNIMINVNMWWLIS